MEAVPHGIGVQNRFELFYDEGLDPLEILKLTEEQKAKKKTDKTVKVKNPKPPATKKPVESVPAKVVKASEADVSSKPKGKPPIQSKLSNQSDLRESEKNNRNRDDNYFGGEARENSEFRRGRGGYRGRGGPARGRGFYPNADNRNRRVFDRKSGSDKSGVKPVDKRDGSGPNNWGDIRSETQRREEPGWDEDFEGEANVRQEFNSSGDEHTNEFGKPDDAKNESMESTETKENDQNLDEQAQEAMKEMTLDEWKKEQEAKRVVPKYNLRKPGEGEDDKQWKKGYVLKKKPKEEDDDDQEDEEDLEDEDFGRKAQQKVLLDIQFNYADSRRGNRGRGRGGRGGPRTGPRETGRDFAREDRPRGNRNAGPTKGKGQQAAPRVDDFNDFPSLIN